MEVKGSQAVAQVHSHRFQGLWGHEQEAASFTDAAKGEMGGRYEPLHLLVERAQRGVGIGGGQHLAVFLFCLLNETGPLGGIHWEIIV